MTTELTIDTLIALTHTTEGTTKDFKNNGKNVFYAYAKYEPGGDIRTMYRDIQAVEDIFVVHLGWKTIGNYFDYMKTALKSIGELRAMFEPGEIEGMDVGLATKAKRSRQRHAEQEKQKKEVPTESAILEKGDESQEEDSAGEETEATPGFYVTQETMDNISDQMASVTKALNEVVAYNADLHRQLSCVEDLKQENEKLRTFKRMCEAMKAFLDEETGAKIGRMIDAMSSATMSS